MPSVTIYQAHEWTVGDHAWARFDHEWAMGGRAWAQIDHGWTVCDHAWAQIDHGWAASDLAWARFDHEWAMGGRAWARFDHGWTVCDHAWARFDHGWTVCDHAWACFDHEWAAGDLAWSKFLFALSPFLHYYKDIKAIFTRKERHQMKTYGQIYKTLRQNKHISLREASGDIVSKSQLSRFENNLSELSFSKVLDILDNINVSYDEYMYLVRNYQRNEQILFFETVGRLEKLRKFDDLYALYMTEKEKNRKFYSKFSDLRLIAVKMVLNAHQKMAAPSPLEIEQLCDYLLSVVNWGQFELYLSLSAVAFVKLQTIKLFLEEIPQRIEFFQNSPENHRLLLMLYRNIIITSIVKKNQQLAQQVLQDYEASIQTSFDVNLHLEYKMLTAEYAFEFIDFQTGEQILSQVIEVYRNFGDLNTAELYQKEIELQKNLKL